MRHVGGGNMVEVVEGSGDWRRKMAGVLKSATASPRLYAGPASTVATFYLTPPRTRKTLADQQAWLIEEGSGDSDKLLRNLFDAAQDAGVIVNDAQFLSAIVEKRLADADNPAGVAVTIWALFDA